MDNDLLLNFNTTSTGGTSNQSNQHDQTTLVGLNEVQRAMVSRMVNESLVNTISKQQVPNFFKDKPELWFILLEAEFNASKTRNDETKYYSVIRALDPETLQLVTDVLHNPPAIDKYKCIKETLIKRTSVSREKQIHQLLKQMDLADKKPTQLLREMRELAGDSVSDDMLHQLWLDRMPHHIKPILVASPNLNLNAVAEVADRVTDITRSSYVMATSTFSQKEAPLSASFTRKNSRSRSTSRSRSYAQSDKTICFYHHQFGNKANRCTPPCANVTSPQGN